MVAPTIPADWSKAQRFRFDETRSEAKFASDLHLEMWAETIVLQLANESSDDESLEVMRAHVEPIAAGISHELDRRQDLRTRGIVPNTEKSESYEALRELIEEVKSTVTIPEFLDSTVWQYQRGKKESHMPCPICGGDDRFVMSHSLPSLGWCRRCHWGTDVIGMAGYVWRLDPRSADDLSTIAAQLGRRFLATGAARK